MKIRVGLVVVLLAACTIVGLAACTASTVSDKDTDVLVAPKQDAGLVSRPETMSKEDIEKDEEAKKTAEAEAEAKGEHLICQIVERHYSPTSSGDHYLLLKGYSLKDNTNDSNKNVEYYTLADGTEKNSMGCTVFGMNLDVKAIEVLGAKVDRSDLDAHGAYVIVDCAGTQQYNPRSS